MCMNCGCGEPNERHHPTDITRDDLQHAADGAGMNIEEAARNLKTSAGEMSGEGASSTQGASQ
jgi:hypothetical protein